MHNFSFAFPRQSQAAKWFGLVLVCLMAVSWSSGARASSDSDTSVIERKWVESPRVNGRLTASDLGMVINTEDPYSVKVGEYYAKARGLSEAQILRVSLPVKSTLMPEEFVKLKQRIDEFFGDRVQALALVWRMPYSVNYCNAITAAVTLGFDGSFCKQSCVATRPSKYFGSVSTQPYRDHKMRLSMLLAASSVEGAKELIDRGVKSDGSLTKKGAPAPNVHFVTTFDLQRNVRKYFFPPEGKMPGTNVQVHLDETEAIKNKSRVLMYLTGSPSVDYLDTNEFLPGALADHLTSFGGVLDQPHGQMTVLSWIGAGATATYGTTSEPCAHWQKFPHPQALLLFYVNGATAIESYWKSVLWPQQGLFVGEPLAAPFSRALP
jgi:uncharacterized protein (TIGR03790 family)